MESGEIYNDLIASLSEPLSILFRKAYSLLMSYLNLLDRITVGYDCSDKDVEELTAVCEGLYRISQLVTSFDIKIAITLWKAISRYVTQHKVLLRDRLDLAGMVTYLCAEIQRGYTYLFTIVPVLDENGQPLSSQGDEKAFLKSVKILGFQMKVLVMLVKEYEGYLADCERPIYILLLHLYRMQPPGLSAPSLFRDHQEEIERQLINATEPVLFHLLGCDRFITCLTSDDTGGSEDLALSHLILQVIVLGLLPTLSDDIQNKWLIPSSYTEDEPRDGIIDAVFASFEKCHREILMGGKVPGVMCSGKAQRFVSLYEHVCTRLCGYVATLSTIQFGLLESCLLQHVVSVDPLAAQLAMDVWCFVTRYGSAELCLSHVSLLCETVRLCGVSQCPEYRRLLQLVGRLVKFMAPEHQEELLTLCPFKENCVVWSCLPLSEISSVVRAKIMKEIVPQCTDAMRRWIEADPKQMSLLKHLNDRLEVLCNVASTDGIQEEGGLQELIDCHCKMWSCLPDMREPSCLSSVCSTTYRLQIKLGGYLLPSFSNAALFQVLKAATKLLNEGIPVDLKLTICHFLQRCGQQRLPPSFEQAQILSLLPRLFHPLLTDCCEHVQHSACQAVAAFATRHPSVVEESLQSNPGLQEKVFRYIQKDGVFGLSNTDKVALFSSQKETLEKFKNLTVEDRLKLPPLFQPISSQESSMADFSGDDIFCDLLDSKSEEVLLERLIFHSECAFSLVKKDLSFSQLTLQCIKQVKQPAPKKLKLDTEKNEVPVSTEYADLLVTTQKAVERWIDIFKSGSVPSSILDGVRKTAEDLSKVVASQNDHGR